MHNTQESNKNTILISLVIGLHFLWCGSAYLSWLYRVIDLIQINHLATSVDMLSEVWAYVFQVIGIACTCLLLKKTAISFSKGRTVFMVISLFHMLLIIPSLFTTSYGMALFLGFSTNILIGYETGYYLVMLTEMVPVHKRGFAFGLGYSIGSIGSWLLSLFKEDNFLKSHAVIIVYILILALTFALLMLVNADIIPEKEYKSTTPGLSLILLTGFTIFLFCFIKGVGFYFPMADITTGNVSLELSRAFYAIGLILAGLLNDYKRNLGAIACIAALIFPFALLALQFSPASSLYIWILGYIFTGFYAVYRVIVFSDISDQITYGLFLAPFGLLFGRLGDAISAAIGVNLSSKPNILVILNSIVFIGTILLSYFLFQKLYQTAPVIEAENTVTPEETIAAFAIYHDLSGREREVLPFILTGKSNSEISSELFISENTVKFHVRNILKKTGCSNRQELYKSFNYHCHRDKKNNNDK